MFRLISWRKLLFRFDWALFLAVFLLILLGLVNLWGSIREQQYTLFGRQLSLLGLGMVLFFAVASVDYRVLARYAYLLFGLGVFFLVVVLVSGRMVSGARRWVDLGASNFQPSELMKVLLLLALGKYLNDTPALEGRTMKHLLVPLGLIALPVLLVAAQPDLGTAMIILLVSITVLVAASMRAGTLAAIGALAILAVAPLWEYGLRDYQKSRVLAFLNPAMNPATAWQPQQAMNAVGSGRFIGKGFLEGTQIRLRYLPALYTDFPFAVWAEEWGFVGGILVLAIYTALILWCLKIASEARDRFGAGICIGVASIFFWQVTMNVGMVTGVLPVVGVTLPLISYGGSSALTMLIALGLVMSVSVRRYSY